MFAARRANTRDLYNCLNNKKVLIGNYRNSKTASVKKMVKRVSLVIDLKLQGFLSSVQRFPDDM